MLLSSLRLYWTPSSLWLHPGPSSTSEATSRQVISCTSTLQPSGSVGLLYPSGFTIVLIPTISVLVCQAHISTSVTPTCGSSPPPAPSQSIVSLVLPGLSTKAPPWILPPLVPLWAFIRILLRVILLLLLSLLWVHPSSPPWFLPPLTPLWSSSHWCLPLPAPHPLLKPYRSLLSLDSGLQHKDALSGGRVGVMSQSCLVHFHYFGLFNF